MSMTVGVVGLGLIGGSIGLALREPSRRIIGFDVSPEACKEAQSRACVDEIAPLDAVAAADVVFVASPPVTVPEMLEQVFQLKPPETVVTDCASVKAAVMRWAETRKEPQFVGGHPMAGHERGGAKYASAWLFRGARWLLTPTRWTDAAAKARVREVVKLMGAEPVVIGVKEHDRHVATVSHLPHVLAAVLAELAKDLEHVDAAGGSWRDLTRVAGVEPELWTQILVGNSEQVARVLADTEARLADLRGALEREDRNAVREFFMSARQAKVKATR
jgi:prephenate dehydrogenase